MKIPLADWKCSFKERKYINDVLDSGWLTYGTYCKRLEKVWSNFHNCRYGVINNSGTSSLQLAFKALKERYHWQEGTEILVPAITFPATINMVIESGLKPILVDVDIDGMFNIQDVRKKITFRTKGICIVHLWGKPYPRKNEIVDICNKHDLTIVEDSCETISHEVGDWGEVSCFSMYFNHIINAGVGGMACTNDIELEYLMRSLANHGMQDVTALPKYKRFTFSRVGYSMRVTELEAALGCAQFESISIKLKKREQIAKWLEEEFKRIRLNHKAELIGGLMLYPVVFTDISGPDIENLLSFLDLEGIETRRMMPITNQEAFRNLVDNYENFPGARKINNRGMLFPIHTSMTKDHCRFIANRLKEWLDKAGFNGEKNWKKYQK